MMLSIAIDSRQNEETNENKKKTVEKTKTTFVGELSNVQLLFTA